MHIEPTSRCTLACPACPRTWFSDKFNRSFPKQDLDLNQLERFLDCRSGENVSTMMLNGNHGDPIYYPHLLNLIQKFRSKSFKISTNGSYQKPEFWYQLADNLTINDTVFFSIDGLEHNNHLYRKNSNWNSIMQGLDIMTKSSCRVVWKTLIFSYNAGELDQIRSMAESRGALFMAEPTSRFGFDWLKPQEHQIDQSRLYEKSRDVVEIDPQCSVQEYISADGYFWPCCLISSMFSLHKTKLWKQRSEWSITSQNLDQARIRLENWKQEILNNPQDADVICKMNCKPGQKFAWSSM
jgi:MoaA/NifB/PqqE/SkfB family radical SAM enzyme